MAEKAVPPPAYYDMADDARDLLDNICLYLSNGKKGSFLAIKGGYPLIWDGTIFFDFVKPTKEQESAFIKKLDEGDVGYKSNFLRFPKDSLGEKAAIVAFCAASKVKNYETVTDFLKAYIKSREGQSYQLVSLKKENLENVDTLIERLFETQEHEPSETKSIIPLVDHNDSILVNLIKTPIYEDLAPQTQSLSPLNHTSFPLEGRIGERKKLNDFVADDNTETFQMLFVVAPSGAGKTRLVTQWMRNSKDLKSWVAGIACNEKLYDGWNEWAKDTIQHDTLIVIDYLYRFKDVAKLIAEKGDRMGQEASQDAWEKPNRLRLLILDHVIPNDSSYDSFSFNQIHMLGGKRTTVQSRTAYFHPHSPILLSSASDKETKDMLEPIIASAYGKKDDTNAINDAYNKLVEIDKQTNSSRHPNDYRRVVTYPLFAILIGQTLRELNGASDSLKDWQLNNLTEDFFFSRNRIPWTQNVDTGKWIGLSISAATALQDIEFEVVFNTLQVFNDIDGDEQDDIISACNDITASSDDVFLRKFEPDVLGETFFYLFFKKFRGVRDVRESFFDIFNARLQEKGNEFSVNSKVVDFAIRAVRNVVNTNQTSRYAINAWKVYTDFLNPKNFLKDSGMYLTACVAGIEVLKVIAQSQSEISQNVLLGIHKNIDAEYLTDIYQRKFSLTQSEEGDTIQDSVPMSPLIVAFFNLSLRFNLFSEALEKTFLKFVRIFESNSNSNCNRFHLFVTWDAPLLINYFISRDDATDINQRDEKGITSLMYAPFAHDKHEVVEILLKKPEIKPNIVQSEYGTALSIAIQRGKTNIALSLIRSGKVDVNQLCGMKLNYTALMMACTYHGDIRIVEALLKHPDIKVNLRNSLGDNGLILACSNGYSDIVELLLNRKDIKLNCLTRDILLSISYRGKRCSALVNTILTSQWSTASLLLDDPRTKVMQKNRTGETALSFLHYAEDSDFTKRFLSHERVKALAKQEDLDELFRSFCLSGDAEQVTYFLTEGFIQTDISKGLAYGLFTACAKGHLDIISLIINQTDIDILTVYEDDGNEFCGLKTLCRKGHSSIASILIEDTDIYNRLGSKEMEWLLDGMCKENAVELCKKLIKHDEFDPDIRLFKDRCTLNHAVANGSFDVAKLLRRVRGFDVSDEDSSGETAASQALKKRNLEMFAILCNHKKFDDDGNDAVSYFYAQLLNKEASPDGFLKQYGSVGFLKSFLNLFDAQWVNMHLDEISQLYEQLKDHPTLNLLCKSRVVNARKVVPSFMPDATFVELLFEREEIDRAIYWDSEMKEAAIKAERKEHGISAVMLPNNVLRIQEVDIDAPLPEGQKSYCSVVLIVKPPVIDMLMGNPFLGESQILKHVTLNEQTAEQYCQFLVSITGNDAHRFRMFPNLSSLLYVSNEKDYIQRRIRLTQGIDYAEPQQIKPGKFLLKNKVLNSLTRFSFGDFIIDEQGNVEIEGEESELGQLMLPKEYFSYGVRYFYGID